MNDYASANVVLRDPHQPLLNGEVPETVIDVTITAPGLHPAHMLNAAAVAADSGLRAVSKTHPAHRSAQCGRTFPHLPHETTAGRCAGLDGIAAGRNADDTDVMEDLLTVASEDARLFRAGLEVIADGGCQVYGPEDDCFERGRVADGCRAACSPCIAAKVLAGEPLPMEADRG